MKRRIKSRAKPSGAKVHRLGYAAAAGYLLREDGYPILREDGTSKIVRER